MNSTSTSKTPTDRRISNGPDVPILETGDLPADDDWALMKSLAVDRDNGDDAALDAERIAIASDDLD